MRHVQSGRGLRAISRAVETKSLRNLTAHRPTAFIKDRRDMTLIMKAPSYYPVYLS